MIKTGKTGHVSYYVNVGQVLGIVGAIALGWHAISKLENLDGKIEVDGTTVERIADKVERALFYKSIWG